MIIHTSTSNVNQYETIFFQIKMITHSIGQVPDTVPALSFNGSVFSDGLEESLSDLLTQSLNKLLAISFEIWLDAEEEAWLCAIGPVDFLGDRIRGTVGLLLPPTPYHWNRRIVMITSMLGFFRTILKLSSWSPRINDYLCLQRYIFVWSSSCSSNHPWFVNRVNFYVWTLEVVWFSNWFSINFDSKNGTRE